MLCFILFGIIILNTNREQRNQLCKAATSWLWKWQLIYTLINYHANISGEQKGPIDYFNICSCFHPGPAGNPKEPIFVQLLKRLLFQVPFLPPLKNVGRVGGGGGGSISLPPWFCLCRKSKVKCSPPLSLG